LSKINKNNRSEEAGSLNNLGNVFSELKDYLTAKQYYNRSLELSKRISDNKLIAVTYKNLGILYQKQDNFKIAKNTLSNLLN
jgi:tetratricopeptide (TPR) repeat protein